MKIKPTDGQKRVVIEEVAPQIDGGLYSVRRIVGDQLIVRAAIFADGHDHLAVRLLYRHSSERKWQFTAMTAIGNDLWSGSFLVDKIGSWSFTILGSIDPFGTWASHLKKRIAAQNLLDELSAKESLKEIPIALCSGAILVEEAARRARGLDAKRLREFARFLNSTASIETASYEDPCTEEINLLMNQYPDLSLATRYKPELTVWVDRTRARFSSWYELFPRSTSLIPGHHGTFSDVEREVPEIAAMGFDILYLPPIHPIGHAFRKGANNSPRCSADERGSPWAIGDRASNSISVKDSDEILNNNTLKNKTDDGGHQSIHPQLGTFADFQRLVASAKSYGLEIALDIAFQCSPDHPWVTEHPSWFCTRPDGSIQYAENPPKTYKDIYPLNFESADWRSLWDELYSVFEFWIQQGVHVFRVDNPHTKALPFWEWCVGKIHDYFPDTLFLSEAFTRPHGMYALAKRGFTQSYTYFTWRNSKTELTNYLEEITRPPISEYFQPNFWPNTPDILPLPLQNGGRPAFIQRVVLAATLVSSYGIYGPAYELCENAATEPAPGMTASEEYLNSEKYEIRQRDRNAPGSLVPFITLLNQIRRDNPALQSNLSLHFHRIENDNLICYSKSTADFKNTILIVVNLDPFNEQTGWTDLDLHRLGIAPQQNFIVEDLLTGTQYTWHDHRNYVSLRPEISPAHVFRVLRPQPDKPLLPVNIAHGIHQTGNEHPTSSET